MKKEIEWLKCFKENLEADYNRETRERKKLIEYELTWINKRISEVAEEEEQPITCKELMRRLTIMEKHFKKPSNNAGGVKGE